MILVVATLGPAIAYRRNFDLEGLRVSAACVHRLTP